MLYLPVRCYVISLHNRNTYVKAIVNVNALELTDIFLAFTEM